MNLKTTLSPDDLARACAEAMWKEDDASKGLGMEILEIKAGKAVLAIKILPHMVNGHGIAHGGFFFTLADSAVSFSCHSPNESAVAAPCNISLILPRKPRDLLVATAPGNSPNRRSRNYGARVTLA